MPIAKPNPGDPPPTASWLNSLAAAAAGRWRLGRGLAKDGDAIGLVGGGEMIAKLTAGAGTGSNPYAWTRVRASGSGAFATDSTWTGSDAYEVNAATGLGGKVVKLRYSEAGDWRFVVESQPTPCSSSLCIFVTGCGLPRAGCTVSFFWTDPTTFMAMSLVASTDANGRACLSPSPAAVVSVSVAACGDFNGASTSLTPGACTTEVVTIPLTLKSGFECLGCTSGTCADLPDTLHFTFDPSFVAFQSWSPNPAPSASAFALSFVSGNTWEGCDGHWFLRAQLYCGNAGGCSSTNIYAIVNAFEPRYQALPHLDCVDSTCFWTNSGCGPCASLNIVANQGGFALCQFNQSSFTYTLGTITL